MIIFAQFNQLTKMFGDWANCNFFVNADTFCISSSGAATLLQWDDCKPIDICNASYIQFELQYMNGPIRFEIFLLIFAAMSTILLQLAKHLRFIIHGRTCNRLYAAFRIFRNCCHIYFFKMMSSILQSFFLYVVVDCPQFRFFFQLNMCAKRIFAFLSSSLVDDH